MISKWRKMSHNVWGRVLGGREDPAWGGGDHG